MILQDGHVHLEQGPLSVDYVEQFINQAYLKGLKKLQILDHSHRFIEFEPTAQSLKTQPQQAKWLTNKFKDRLQSYVNLIETIRQRPTKIPVSFGLEVCYTPASEEFLRRLLPSMNFDFLVGSIHSIDGRLYDMPFSDEILWNQKNHEELIRQYYDCVHSLLKSGLFTQLGHVDTIKIGTSLSDQLFINQIKTCCKLAVENHVLIECNTGCHWRYGHPDLGLSDTWLDCAKLAQCELILASDAHRPEDVGNDLDLAGQRCQNGGYINESENL